MSHSETRALRFQRPLLAQRLAPIHRAVLVLTTVFIAFLLLMIGLKYWLAWRQIRHVTAHAGNVPRQFSEQVTPAAHRKAAAYTVARTRMGIVETAVGAAMLLALTLLGGLQWLNETLLSAIGPGLWQQVALVGSVVLLLSAVDLPFSLYRQFRIEERFGFNRMTLSLWLADLAKSLLLSAVLGLPLLAAVLWLMQSAGTLWWLYAWLVWMGFNALVLLLYPTFIAPLFNRFEPLKDETLAQRVAALLARTGFSSKGVYVMDGSRRSAHGNAYFTGFGRSKRIVFFDTLIERLQPAEIEAVLAHELGHFKLRHIAKRLAMSFFASLALLALLGWLATQTWFYTGLGVTPALHGGNEGLALVLFMLVLPVFGFVLSPLATRLSRKHEFEADRFAAQVSSADDLARALTKLYQDNAATLTPDPVHSAFYDSHPPPSIRIERLAQATAS